MPIAMQPRSGEVSKIAHTPQKVNSIVTAMISRLSVEWRVFMMTAVAAPKRPPRTMAARHTATGRRVLTASIPVPWMVAVVMEIATLYASSPRILSTATTCSSVSTKTPFA